jgi:hypothetical protein
MGLIVKRLLRSWQLSWVSMLIAVAFAFMWVRQIHDESGMHCDDFDLTCYFGIGVCSFHDQVYFSVFREPSWRFSLHPAAFVRVTSRFRESSAFFNFVVMQEYGDSIGHFGFVATMLEKEYPPAFRMPVCILMLPHWVLVVLFALLPLSRFIMNVAVRYRSFGSAEVEDHTTKTELDAK